MDGGGSPPGQTDSRRISESFFEVGVVFLVLNLNCGWGGSPPGQTDNRRISENFF